MAEEKWSNHVGHLEEGGLHGWCAGCPPEERHRAIERTVKTDGYATAIRRLNFLANVANRRDYGDLHKVAREDVEWTERWGKGNSGGWTGGGSREPSTGPGIRSGRGGPSRTSASPSCEESQKTVVPPEPGRKLGRFTGQDIVNYRTTIVDPMVDAAVGRPPSSMLGGPSVNLDPFSEVVLSYLFSRSYESSELDFKESLETAKGSEFPRVARHFFGMSNYGGGFLLVGFRPKPTGGFLPVGVAEDLPHRPG